MVLASYLFCVLVLDMVPCSFINTLLDLLYACSPFISPLVHVHVSVSYVKITKRYLYVTEFNFFLAYLWHSHKISWSCASLCTLTSLIFLYDDILLSQICSIMWAPNDSEPLQFPTYPNILFIFIHKRTALTWGWETNLDKVRSLQLSDVLASFTHTNCYHTRHHKEVLGPFLSPVYLRLQVMSKYCLNSVSVLF